MSPPWTWPGARWWRCDLHVHSPVSHDFRDADADAAAWLEAALDAGIDAVAITDHDSGAFIDDVRQQQASAARDIAVFAGVELTTAEGVHLLALFSEADGSDHVKELLGACGVPAAVWGRPEGRAAKGFKQCLELAAQRGAICIAPHADVEPRAANTSKASLLVGIPAGRTLDDILASPALRAAEVFGDDPAKHRKLRGYDPPELRRRNAPGLALVRFSDAHALDQIGRRSTWIKMTRPTRDGLLLALGDGQPSVQYHAEGLNPNDSAALAIESMTIEHARLVGREAPFVLRLNPWLNAIIGGRGAGKSTLVNLLRLVLRRADDLPATVRKEFDEFARVPSRRGDSGALCSTTRISLVYRKEGARFRASWSTDGSAEALEEQVDGAWEPAHGTVRQRLPVAIYSQNEIHEIARQPRALLRIVDESTAVDRGTWKGTWDAEHSRFLALRAQIRQLASGLEREDDLRGELADLQRKLAVFESTEHSAVLRKYQRRERQRLAIDRWMEEVTSVANDLQAAAASAVVDDLPGGAFDADDEADREVVALARRWADDLRSRLAQVQELADGADSVVKTWYTALISKQWSSAAQAAKAEYDSLTSWLRNEGVEHPEQFAELVQRRQLVEQRLADMDSARNEIQRVEGQAGASLATLVALRNGLSDRRNDFLASVLKGNPLVQVRAEQLGDLDDLQTGLRGLLGLDGDVFEDDLRSCAKLFGDGSGSPFERLESVKNRMRQLARGDDLEVADRRFRSRVRGLPPETLDRIEAWFPEDRLLAQYGTAGGSFRDISQGSAGQRNAAILAFLLSYGEAPMIIDQPENELDNRLISELIVEQLRASKLRRQLVVVTHNPNLVVNADAEYVIALDILAGEVKAATQGGLQETPVRDAVCEIMEGGREAFELRYHRIGEHPRV